MGSPYSGCATMLHLMAAGLLSTVWNTALDLVFPPRCVACGEFGAFVCPSCAPKMTAASPPRCERCWMPVDGRGCARCLAQPPAFTAARSAYVYEGAVREAVHALKFGGVSAIAPPMAKAMAETFLVWQPPADVVVPVPLSAARLRRRGYNQAALLAQGIARRAGLRVEQLLRRAADTPAQALLKDERARRANVAGAFALRRPAAGRRVLLVDDVLTTGATLGACARVLLDGGAPAVYVLTYARED